MAEDTAPPPAASPRNVSDQFTDLAPEDSVYETADGYLVKVKVFWDDTPVAEDPALAVASQHGAEKFRVTGSIVGANGKALKRSCGRHAIHDLKRSHTHHADQLEDPTIGLEVARLLCVQDTVTAEKHYQMLHGGYMPGFSRLTQHRARKAAEAQKEATDAVP